MYDYTSSMECNILMYTLCISSYSDQHVIACIHIEIHMQAYIMTFIIYIVAHVHSLILSSEA